MLSHYICRTAKETNTSGQGKKDKQHPRGWQLQKGSSQQRCQRKVWSKTVRNFVNDVTKFRDHSVRPSLQQGKLTSRECANYRRPSAPGAPYTKRAPQPALLPRATVQTWDMQAYKDTLWKNNNDNNDKNLLLTAKDLVLPLICSGLKGHQIYIHHPAAESSFLFPCTLSI